MMGLWNNRVWQAPDGTWNVYETFYDEDGNIDGVAEDPEIRDGFAEIDHLISHVELIAADLKRMKEGLLPPIDMDKFPNWWGDRG